MEGIQVILRDGGTFTIDKKIIDYWKEIYPDLDVEYEIGYLKEMWSVGAIPRRTSKNIIKHINKWLYEQNGSREDYEKVSSDIPRRI